MGWGSEGYLHRVWWDGVVRGVCNAHLPYFLLVGCYYRFGAYLIQEGIVEGGDVLTVSDSVEKKGLRGCIVELSLLFSASCYVEILS